MLPDFPSLKKKLHDLIIISMELEQIQASPILGRIPRHIIHEGNRTVSTDGEEKESPIKTYKVERTVDVSEIELLTIKEVYERYRAITLDFVREQTTDMLREFESVTTATGNVVDAGGQPLTPEIAIRILEMIEIDFDGYGNPYSHSLVAQEQIIKQWPPIIEQLRKEPYKSQIEEIMDRKKREWYDRESNRKLVD